MKNVAKIKVIFIDLSNFTEVSEVYYDFIASKLPARAVVQVSKLPLNTDVKIICLDGIE